MRIEEEKPELPDARSSPIRIIQLPAVGSKNPTLSGVGWRGYLDAKPPRTSSSCQSNSFGLSLGEGGMPHPADLPAPPHPPPSPCKGCSGLEGSPAAQNASSLALISRRNRLRLAEGFRGVFFSEKGREGDASGSLSESYNRDS